MCHEKRVSPNIKKKKKFSRKNIFEINIFVKDNGFVKYIKSIGQSYFDKTINTFRNYRILIFFRMIIEVIFKFYVIFGFMLFLRIGLLLLKSTKNRPKVQITTCLVFFYIYRLLSKLPYISVYQSTMYMPVCQS